MSQKLIVAALLSVLAVPLLAQGSRQSPAKSTTRTGQAGAGNTKQNPPPNPSTSEQTKEAQLTRLQRAKIVGMASDGAQITVIEVLRLQVDGKTKGWLSAATNNFSGRQPDLRSGETLFAEIDSGKLSCLSRSNNTKPCPKGQVTLYTFESLEGDRIKLAKPEQVLNVPEGALRDRVKEIGVGSIVSLEVETVGGHGTVRYIDIPRVEVSTAWRFWIMLLVFAALVVFAGLAWRGPGRGFHPFKAFLGKDDLYSNSKFQAALWFGVLIVTYLSTLLLRSWKGGLPAGGISIPMNLLMMSGLSVLTFAGAKAIKQNQVDNSGAPGRPAPGQQPQGQQPQGQPAPGQAAQGQPGAGQQPTQGQSSSVAPAGTNNTPRFWFDLTHNDDGTPSLSKLQLVVIVLIALCIYVHQAWDFLSAIPLQAKIALPDVDNALLTAFGLGQGAYLGVKFASDGK